MKKLLVINAGSSSMKFQVYQKDGMKSIASGLAERIFIDGQFSIKYHDQKITLQQQFNSHKDAVKLLITKLLELKIITNLNEIVGIGHRIVQGGESFKKSILIKDMATVKSIDQESSLAPLHNPGELSAVKSFMELIPEAKNVAVFDTSFHQTMPKLNYLYAVPQKWYEKYKVRRYGAHGTSHKYITQVMSTILNKKPNIIICHLGNGASLAAIKDGKSFNTSMGLTPLAGIMMGTRSGDLDPAIVEYMVNQTGKTVQEITSVLNKESGLLAISGISSDFRDVKLAADKGDEKARFAIEFYAKRVVDYIVQYQNDLDNNVDAIIFTAGIGENAAFVRTAIIAKIKTMDVKIDPQKNNIRSSENRIISTIDSKIPVYVIPTDEEIMIVKDLVKLANL